MPARKTTTEEVHEETVEPIHQRMKFFGQVQDTPKEAQKSFNNGRFSGTDINPMWRIKKLTEVFGPAGFGWWTQNVKYNFVNAEQTNETAVFCELELIVVDPDTKEKSNPIYGVGGNTFVAQRNKGPQASDEAMKMAYTDALSIACKALGFSADIYYQADKTKYTAVTPEPSEEEIAEQLRVLTGRIQKGVAKVTENMAKENKDKFVQDVIVKHLGMANFMQCKDMDKLNKLLDELLLMAKKTA